MEAVTKTIAIDIITLDVVKKARSLNKNWATHLSELMADGQEFEPIIVFLDKDNNYILSSGLHRLTAAIKNKRKSILAEIRKGSARDAELHAYSANNDHGLPPTAKEKRQSVINMCMDEQWNAWPDAQIAKHCGVSKMTVNRIKKELVSKGLATKDSVKKVVMNGKETTMNTAHIGRVAKEEQPQEDEGESFDADQMSELSATLSDLEEENRKLKDVIAVQSWDASDIEKEDAQQIIDDLRERIKVLEIEVDSLRESRDSFQNRCAELMKTVKTLQAKLKKLETV